MLDLSSIKIEELTKVAVAVSGGRDSLCLLSKLSKQIKTPIFALIVDHKLRPESTTEAEQTRIAVKKMGAEAIVLTWEGQKPSSNIHEQARDKRYSLMTEYCKENGISHLFLGHNKDDQAETIFHRIYRGTGIAGLGGMKAIELRDGINIVRPMLHISRAEITQYMQTNSIVYVDDPSNESEKYERVKIRNFLNSHYDADVLKKRLCLLASNSRRSKSFIQSQLTDFYNSNTKIHSEGYLSFPIDSFGLQHEEIQLRLIAKIIGKFSSPSHPPRLDSLKNICNNLLQNNDCVIGGVEFLIVKDSVIAIREVKKLNNDISSNQVWDNRFKITGDTQSYKILPLTKNAYDEIENIKIRSKIYKTIPAIYTQESNFVACPILKHNPSKIDIEFTCLLK